MEQMRFGFNYVVDIDENEIDQQIEIPAMLLQPFVENAVKHGVSSLKEQGHIRVSITKKGSTLLLAVKDNGSGFTGKSNGGLGIKLCEDRIKLLNSIYKNTHIALQIVSDSNGTLIAIELQNWI
jgi:two-component system LytT family sensor kinase